MMRNMKLHLNLLIWVISDLQNPDRVCVGIVAGFISELSQQATKNKLDSCHIHFPTSPRSLHGNQLQLN